MSLSMIAAAGFDIHVFMAEDFIAALDDSGDLPDGSTMDDFDNVLISKYMEMDPMLINDLDMMGIEQPVLVEIEDDGSWTFVDGHHRLSWAAQTNEPVPVCFVTFDVDAIALYNVMSEYDVFYDH